MVFRETFYDFQLEKRRIFTQTSCPPCVLPAPSPLSAMKSSKILPQPTVWKGTCCGNFTNFLPQLFVRPSVSRIRIKFMEGKWEITGRRSRLSVTNRYAIENRWHSSYEYKSLECYRHVIVGEIYCRWFFRVWLSGKATVKQKMSK